MSGHRHVRRISPDYLKEPLVRNVDYVLVQRFGPGYVRHYKCTGCGEWIGITEATAVKVGARAKPSRRPKPVPIVEIDPGPVPEEDLL